MGSTFLGRVRPTLRQSLALLAGALALTAATGQAYQRTGPEYVRYEGAGPGWDSTRVVVGGWPLPYLLDKPYLSPVGSVDLVAGLLGEDELRPGRFLADLAFHAVLLWGLWSAAGRLRRRRALGPAAPHGRGTSEADATAEAGLKKWEEEQDKEE